MDYSNKMRKHQRDLSAVESKSPLCQIVWNIKQAKPKLVLPFIKTVKHNADLESKYKQEELLATAENPYTKTAEQTTNICTELKEIKHKEFLEMKRRQQLYNNNHELRTLEAQLKTAWVAKELVDQRMTNLNLEAAKLEEDKKFNKAWKLECDRNKQLLLDDEKNERKKKAQFMMDIKKQMHDIEMRRAEERAKIIESRTNMEKYLERLKMEDEAKRKKYLEMQQMRKTEMEEAMRERAKQKLLAKQKDIDDFNAYIQHQKEKDALNAKIVQERNKLLAERAALSERISKQLEELQKEQIERDNLLLSLLIEERKAKEDERYRRNMEKQIQLSKDIVFDMEMYNQNVKPVIERVRREEERKILMSIEEYFDAYDKMTQKSLEERKRKLLEHGRIIQAMIEERRKQRTVETAEQIKQDEMMIALQRDKDQQVEEERLRLLRSQPPEILRFLPKGFIRPSDAQYFSLSTNNKQE